MTLSLLCTTRSATIFVRELQSHSLLKRAYASYKRRARRCNSSRLLLGVVMKRVLFTLALTSLAGISQAGAYGITVTPGPASPSAAAYFDPEAIGAADFTLDGLIWSLVSGTDVVREGTTSAYAAPAGLGDLTKYFAVEANSAEKAVFPSARTSLKIFWGSIDSNVGDGFDNIITFSDGVTISGATLVGLGDALGNGSQTAPRNNEWVLISGLPAFTSATFSTTRDAFEFALPAVPEPSTWGMLGLGFACLGYVATRRSAKSRATIR